MIVCLVFVFASLIEYAIVNVIARRRNIQQSVSGNDIATAASSSKLRSPGCNNRKSRTERTRWPPQKGGVRLEKKATEAAVSGDGLKTAKTAAVRMWARM